MLSVRLFVTPWTVAHQAPLFMGILQARILEWIAMPSSRGIVPTQGLNPGLPAAAKSLQSCPTLCDPTDGSPPGSPVPGILQARTLEWVAIAFSQVSLVTTKSPAHTYIEHVLVINPVNSITCSKLNSCFHLSPSLPRHLFHLQFHP